LNQAIDSATANSWQSEEALGNVRIIHEELRDATARKKVKRSGSVRDRKAKSSGYQLFCRNERNEGGVAYGKPVHVAAPLLSAKWDALSQEQQDEYNAAYAIEYVAGKAGIAACCLALWVDACHCCLAGNRQRSGWTNCQRTCLTVFNSAWTLWYGFHDPNRDTHDLCINNKCHVFDSQQL
jgi:hypothetical protein